MSPWDQQTSDGADKGRTQTPHAGVQPQELEVARTAVHVADRLTSFFSSRRGAAPCHCTLKCTPKEPRGQAYHSVPLTTFTLRQVDDYACHNGEAQLLTDQVRALEPGTPAYAYAKGLLCSYCPVGVVSPFRAQQFMAGNGLACYELDAAYDVAAAREALEVDPSIARAALSPGGRGFHVVIPVAPEPTSVSELQWALKQVHDHLVYRYGPLFGKIDRGLTSGIELHYVASDPTRIFRETALPLMTGAPPARYTEDRRRFVPGFGDGASGGAGRLGPFEDTTDADSLAWRDRTRQRIRSALEYLDLPDGSRNDVWIPVGFCLVGAELEGRALYEVTIGARQIFIDWTHAAAYEGSTKPNRAGEEFDRLANDFDLDRAQVGSLEGLYSRARSAGWDGKVGDAGGQGSADASGQYDEAPDTEPEEAANGAESTDEPDGEDNGQGEARQTSDDSPLDQFTRPCPRNINDASNFARLIKYFSGNLVIALPDIYAVDSRGMLSSAPAGSLLLKTGRLYYAECYGLKGAERHACADDARKLGNDGVLERLCGGVEVRAIAGRCDTRDATRGVRSAFSRWCPPFRLRSASAAGAWAATGP